MKPASSVRGTANSRSRRKGSMLAAALALTFLIFAIVTVSLARVAGSYVQMSLRHRQTSALFLAEAGIQKAAHRLIADADYSGESGARLGNGVFDVSVTPAAGRFVVRSTGYSGTQASHRARKTVRAKIAISGESFRISDWREDP